MLAPSPTQTSVYDLQRQELLARVAQYRTAEAARQIRSAEKMAVMSPRFARVRSCVRSVANALSPVAFGFSNR
jgi:hypothetical protein